ncbi:DNA polymerase III subunit gamma and tau [Nocardioides mesophilus]|uniref:DNA polymerase III subunit gamma and tau n=1 Tax=Nocardioides mesophilus TaxID=433659 RepID=UPI001CB6B830|nr:DNA polymerase III subunit gamma and tau [Nocardioides mesophilus]
MEAPLALYRRYRPETFAEVIGQDHVTTPLRAALKNNRVHHAYLFSGPRGCGKTTSARILARCLNCEQGPTDTPCGVCQSCVDLARGGPGSIDVIEIDAASHGGVDDARDLRERAFFAPVSSRYKIYIIDEAHMVSPAGFNALLKLVEEPPEHIKFVFATTEPEKVIGTIRSRTHHYPFRLIPPRTLSDYLQELCDQEQVQVEPAALPLVVRAGGGSARDTLSVLDQLIGGAGPEGVTYELTTGLLGFTPETLLDEVVDAFAADDAGTVFGVVDKVIETGQDPRRFTEDLLRRLRDLLIIAAVPDAPATGLIDLPQDQAERLVAQAARFGRADLSRAADLVAAGLTELKGATAPRLLLELICARVLLPGADHGTAGVMARLDRIEKRMAIEGTPSAALPASGAAAPAPARREDAGAGSEGRSAAAATRRPEAPTREATQSPAAAHQPAPQAPAASPAVSAAPQEAWPTATTPGADRQAAEGRQQTEEDRPQTEEDRPQTEEDRPQAQDQAPAAVPPAAEPAPTSDRPAAEAVQPAGHPAQPAPQGQAAAHGLGLVEVRRLWPDILDAVKLKRRYTWILLSQNGQVTAVDEKTLTVALVNAGARNSFSSGGSEEILRQACIDVVGHDWRIEAIVDPTAEPGAGGPMTIRTHDTRPVESAAPQPGAPASAGPPPPGDQVPAAEPEPPQRRPVDPSAVASAREAIQDTRHPGEQRAAATPSVSDDDAHRDDPDADDDLGGTQLLQRELGASIIEEIPHS